MLRNPLAEPYVLGISAGASTGAVCVMILGFGYGVLGLSSGAFIGAVIAFLLVGFLATGAGGSGERIILCGVAGSQLFNALTSYIVTTSANAEQARGILFWLLGSLSGVRWPDVYLSVPIALAGFIICMAHVRALDAFAFGTDAAASLGIPIRRVQIVLFGMTAAMTASVVSMVGSIGFVGLVIPHAARFLVGPGLGGCCRQQRSAVRSTWSAPISSRASSFRSRSCRSASSPRSSARRPSPSSSIACEGMHEHQRR